MKVHVYHNWLLYRPYKPEIKFPLVIDNTYTGAADELLAPLML